LIWATGLERSAGEILACGIICFTVINASASVSPIITATDTQATALYAPEFVHSFIRPFLLIRITI
jgi:hypothetical protein